MEMLDILITTPLPCRSGGCWCWQGGGVAGGDADGTGGGVISCESCVAHADLGEAAGAGDVARNGEGRSAVESERPGIVDVSTRKGTVAGELKGSLGNGGGRRSAVIGGQSECTESRFGEASAGKISIKGERE